MANDLAALGYDKKEKLLDWLQKNATSPWARRCCSPEELRCEDLKRRLSKATTSFPVAPAPL